MSSCYTDVSGQEWEARWRWLASLGIEIDLNDRFQAERMSASGRKPSLTMGGSRTSSRSIGLLNFLLSGHTFLPHCGGPEEQGRAAGLRMEWHLRGVAWAPSGLLGIVERGTCRLLRADLRPRLDIKRELSHRACRHVRDLC